MSNEINKALADTREKAFKELSEKDQIAIDEYAHKLMSKFPELSLRDALAILANIGIYMSDRQIELRDALHKMEELVKKQRKENKEKKCKKNEKSKPLGSKWKSAPIRRMRTY